MDPHRPHLCKDYSDEPFDESRARPLPEKATPFTRFFGGRNNTLQQRIEQKKRGIGRQRYPVLSKPFPSPKRDKAEYLPTAWTLAVAMLAVFIYELVLNSKAQGTPISFHV